MQRPPVEPTELLRWLADRAEITELISAYAHTVDSRDWAAWQNLFTMDAYFEGRFEHLDKSELAGALESLFRDYPVTVHNMSSLAITIDGDTAHTRFYLYAIHLRREDEPFKHADVGGWYECDVRRTPDGWKFCGKQLLIKWAAGESLVLNEPNIRPESLSS